MGEPVTARRQLLLPRKVLSVIGSRNVVVPEVNQDSARVVLCVLQVVLGEGFAEDVRVQNRKPFPLRPGDQLLRAVQLRYV